MTTTRKPHVRVDQADIQAYVDDVLIADVSEVAIVFDIHAGTARRHLDGLWHQGKLVRDEHDEDGRRLPFELYRYGRTTS